MYYIVSSAIKRAVLRPGSFWQTYKLAIILEESRDAFTHYITSLVFLATILNLHVIFAHWDESSKKLVLCVFEYGITSRAVLISANIVFDWCSGSFDGCGKKKKNWEFHILVSCSDFMKWISIGFGWIYMFYDV